MAPYDILGNIAIVKFKTGVKIKEKKLFATELLRRHTSVKGVLEKTSRFKGRLRTLKTKWVLGEKTKEVLYKENGCVFRFNVDSCYFSPRLASERLKIAGMIGGGEKVLVMFGGVAPYAIVIAKNSYPKKIVSIELGRECNKYARENVRRNKAEEKIKLIRGDVRKEIPALDEKFDRIIMARPNLKDSFLDSAFLCIKKKGIIHYYFFCKEEEIASIKRNILKEGLENGKKVKILKVKKAGDIGPYNYRWRADLKVS